MSAAALSTFAFPTTGFGALPSDGAFPSGDGGVGDISQFGCPLSAFESLGSVCAATNVPSCAAAQITGTADPFSVTYDAACCTSLSVYGESVASCYSKHAPTCLDTSALLASVTDDSSPDETDIASFSDPCAKYFGGGGKAGGAAATPAPTGKGGSSGGSTVTGSMGGATGSAASGGSGGSSSAAAGGSSSNAASAGKGVGFKVWIGVVGLGALAVLAL